MTSLGMAQLADVAAKTGIAKSALSKILSGEVGLSPTNLRKLVTGLSADPAHQFAILAAHLFDEAERSGFDLNRLSIQAEDTPEGPGFADLPVQLQLNLRTIADRIKEGDEDLGAAISWFAAAIERPSSGRYEIREPQELMAAEAPVVSARSLIDKEKARRAALQSGQKPRPTEAHSDMGEKS